MPYYENQGAQLYYEESGQGKPLIFLHGASLDMCQWKRQIKHFSSSYRVIALDARGHGKSSLPPGNVSSDVFWQDVVAMMDFLCIPKAIICGLSMGGHVAIQVAINAGERVERIILIGAVCTNQFNYYEKIVLPINRFSLRLMPMSWIACPTLILIGDHDSMTRRQQQYIHEHIKNSNLVIIKDAHHGTNLDNPDQVEQEIEKFLAQ